MKKICELPEIGDIRLFKQFDQIVQLLPSISIGRCPVEIAIYFLELVCQCKIAIDFKEHILGVPVVWLSSEIIIII